MIYLYALIAFLIYLPPATWVFYMALMNMERVEDLGLIHPTAKKIGRGMLLPFGAVHNCLFNAIHMTVWFMDLPREFGTTKRMNRYVAGTHERRKAHALIIRAIFLNHYDRRGVHQ